MKFSVNIKDDDLFPVVVLKNEQQKTEAVIYTFGGLLNNFIINAQQNIIDGFASCSDAKENITNGFKSAKLSPFVCRVNNGEYEFQNEKYKTGKFFIGAEAIHGLLYDAMFNIVNSGADNNSAFVTLQYVYSKKDEGFPFEYSCEITYRLKENNQLSITTTIVNKSNKEMPLSDGWHPYFKFNQLINDLLFKINAEQILEFDDKLLPTGKIFSFNEFQTLKKLSDNFFDNCFLLKNTAEPACIIEDIKNKLRLKILRLENYPYLQVYTPPHRNSMAIENLSSAPDAFNNKIGLITLQPSESKTFSTVYQAEYY